jgi:hypothetical protein
VKKHDLYWGAALLTLGVLLLVDRLLGISLWKVIGPLFLIALGLWFIWGVRRDTPDLEAEEVTIPLKDAGQARIRIKHGAGRLHIGAGAGLDELISGTFYGGVDHREVLHGDTLEVEMQAKGGQFPQFLKPWALGKGLDWNMALNGDLAIALHLETGAASAELDLENLCITELVLKTGVSSTEVALPAEAGYTRVSIESGVASASFRVPEGVAARIQSSSGLASIDVDESRFPRKGDIYESPDYEGSQNRVDIKVQMGLGSVSIR